MANDCKKFDLNNDGRVAIDDIFEVAQRFGAKRGDKNYRGYADFNKDGIIDLKDLELIVPHFGEECDKE